MRIKSYINRNGLTKDGRQWVEWIAEEMVDKDMTISEACDFIDSPIKAHCFTQFSGNAFYDYLIEYFAEYEAAQLARAKMC